MTRRFKYYPSGDSGIIIEVGRNISKEIHEKIMNFVQFIHSTKIHGIVELVPSYTTILVIYNPFIVTYKEIVKEIKNLENKMLKVREIKTEVIHIPILYGDNVGPDLEYVAYYNKMSKKEVIKLHSRPLYLVYMIGFCPGFPYLGGMPKKIATPRLESPRQKISSGSVGIAGNQTGVYPIESPGGWRIIGRTPLKLFDPDRYDPILIKAGTYVKFEPINIDQYNKIKESEGNFDNG